MTTHILFLLDRSGSMSSMAAAAISSFNDFLREQSAEPGHARLTLLLFDDHFEIPYQGIPLPEVLPLDETTFVPRGCTALLDAMGTGIDDLGKQLAALPEADRPGKVIVATLTDGEENSSQQYSWQDISRRIRHQSEKYQWEFLFLGANQDAIATAGQLGIHSHNSATFVADDTGMHSGNAALNRKIKSFRKAKGDISAQEAADLQAPMDSILREEDQKRRNS